VLSLGLGVAALADVDEHLACPAVGVNFLLLRALMYVLPAKESLQEKWQLKINYFNQIFLN